MLDTFDGTEILSNSQNLTKSKLIRQLSDQSNQSNQLDGESTIMSSLTMESSQQRLFIYTFIYFLNNTNNLN